MLSSNFTFVAFVAMIIAALYAVLLFVGWVWDKF